MHVEIRFFYNVGPYNDSTKPLYKMEVECGSIGWDLNNFATRKMRELGCVGYHYVKLDNKFFSGSGIVTVMNPKKC